MRLFIAAALAMIAVSLAAPEPASATALKVAPLEYRAVLTEDERQQGFIDISNPSTLSVEVDVAVQAFRQIDDDGGLQFYDDKQVAAAIQPERRALTLGGREAIRLFFTIDGGLLPKGDVYAAIFFTSEPSKATAGIGQSVRVGTILSLINESPGERNATLTDFSMPLIQLSERATGTYRIKNNGKPSTGFYPTVSLTSWPGSQRKESQGSLIFGGRERTNDISFMLGYGLHRVDIRYGDSSRSQWVVTLAPWMIIVLLLAVLIAGVELVLLRRRRALARSKHAG